MATLTKKQKQLLDFIEKFIAENGYSPSYREIKHGMSYSSVGTVANHVNNLEQKGFLQKNGHSARSLEVVDGAGYTGVSSQSTPAAHKWLIDAIDAEFRFVESKKPAKSEDVDKLYVLVGTLKILGLSGAFSAFSARLSDLQRR